MQNLYGILSYKRISIPVRNYQITHLQAYLFKIFPLNKPELLNLFKSLMRLSLYFLIKEWQYTLLLCPEVIKVFRISKKRNRYSLHKSGVQKLSKNLFIIIQFTSKA